MNSWTHSFSAYSQLTYYIHAESKCDQAATCNGQETSRQEGSPNDSWTSEYLVPAIWLLVGCTIHPYQCLAGVEGNLERRCTNGGGGGGGKVGG
jgi:hypothetical protein